MFLSDVRVPDVNRVGDVGDGWRCARTTLMNERVTLSGVTIDPVSLGGGTRRDPWQSLLETVPDRSDPVTRQKLAQLYIDSQVKEMTAFRASAARQRGAQPGPEGAVNKVFNAELNQRRTNFALSTRGLAGSHGKRATSSQKVGSTHSCVHAPTRSKVGLRKCFATRWPSASSDFLVTTRSTREWPGPTLAGTESLRRGGRGAFAHDDGGLGLFRIRNFYTFVVTSCEFQILRVVVARTAPKPTGRSVEDRPVTGS